MDKINSKALVSVIMPFLNAEKFIQEAIKSVVAQTYDNWELLLVDDGSTDDSTAIAQRYADQYSQKIHYLEHNGHQNRGASASRNLGIRHAKGKYIAFLDADDIYLPHKLEQQVLILDSQPEAALLYGYTQYWYSWTGKAEDIQRDYIPRLGVKPNTLVKPPTLLPLFLQQKAAVPCTCSLLVRREVIDNLGGFEESVRSVYDDQVFYAKLCLNVPVFVASGCWDKYRQHPDSRCSETKITGQENSTRLMFLTWLMEYVSAQGIEDGELWQVIQKELWLHHRPNLHLLSKYVRHSMSRMKRLLKELASRILPTHVYRWLQARWYTQEYSPPIGWAYLGSLRRVTPISHEWGFDRGLPIDRYYIEGFLGIYASDIRGHVLEIAADTYIRQFGGDRITKSDVLHPATDNPRATIVGDLSCADHIPSDIFDCVIFTQTLQLIFDVPAALKTLYRILKPGGILLATFPGISKISREDMDRWGHYWAFTTASARRLFAENFPPANLTIEAYGNVLTAIAFLHGLASSELNQPELDYCDPDYELVITVRAVKPQLTS